LLPEEKEESLSLMNPRKVVESAIMKMPISVSRAFGTITRKYITL